jgi:CheY-like chemotaxis protein
MYFERRGAINLVITDLHMGMMDGITLTRSLRKLTPDARIIVSSGHIQKESQETLESLGVKILLDKPYTAEKLLRSVRKALADPKPPV